MLYGEALFHVGICVMCVSAGLAVLFTILFSVSGRRLRKVLDKEYGKKRHG